MIKENYTYLLTRKEASKFLGVDPNTFDKYIRNHPECKAFMIGKRERYTIKSLTEFINNNLV